VAQEVVVTAVVVTSALAVPAVVVTSALGGTAVEGTAAPDIMDVTDIMGGMGITEAIAGAIGITGGAPGGGYTTGDFMVTPTTAILIMLITPLITIGHIIGPTLLFTGKLKSERVPGQRRSEGLPRLFRTATNSVRRPLASIRNNAWAALTSSQSKDAPIRCGR